MLAMADPNGVVPGTIPGFAKIAGVTIDEMRNAFAILTAPDPDSRSKEFDGRRVIVLDNGDWQLVNYAKYRTARDQEERRFQNKEAQARYRANHVSQRKPNVSTRKQASAAVSNVSQRKPTSAQEEVDVEVEVDVEEEVKESKEKSCVQDTHSHKTFTPPKLDHIAAYCLQHNISIDHQRFLDHYTANGWRVGRNPMKDWKAAVRNWFRNDQNKSTGGSRDNTQSRQPFRPAQSPSKVIAEIDAAAPVLNLPHTNGV